MNYFWFEEGLFPRLQEDCRNGLPRAEQGDVPNYLQGCTACLKKWSLVKCHYWGPLKPVCDIPYSFFNLHRTPGHV